MGRATFDTSTIQRTIAIYGQNSDVHTSTDNNLDADRTVYTYNYHKYKPQYLV